MAVGRDMRLSSPAMQEALIARRHAAGARRARPRARRHRDGLLRGRLARARRRCDGHGVAQPEAVHRDEARPPRRAAGRRRIGPAGRARQSHVRCQAPDEVRKGLVAEYDIWPAYVDRVLSFVEVPAIKPLKVVIDAANGMAGTMLPPVLERLPIDAVRCYFEPDGSFPNHEPNPLLPENREFIVRKTLEEGADLGVAFDGDADRCFFVDDTGEFVPGDFVTALFAGSVLEKEPGAKIIYDVRASRAVPDTIERDGGVPLVNRVGHAFIKARMRKEDAAFAGEVSRPLLLPRLQPGRLGRRPVPAHARADLARAAEAVGDPRAAPLALLHHRRDQHARSGRRAEAAGAEGAVRRRARVAPRRDLGRLRRLALQRASLQHRAAAAPQSRGDVARS